MSFVFDVAAVDESKSFDVTESLDDFEMIASLIRDEDVINSSHSTMMA